MMGRWLGGWGYSYGFGWLGMLINMLIFAVIIVMVIRFIRYGGVGCCGNNRNKHTAEEIVRERYAKGEITREQFQEIIKDIKN